MRNLPFKASHLVSLGIELEFQIIDPNTYAMASNAKDLIRAIRTSTLQEKIKPEITQSMIEINSSVHQSTKNLYNDLQQLQQFLLTKANKLGIKIAGGGTHPFQQWKNQKIFPSSRFKNLSRQYRYLSKRSTVFGLHMHIGCTSADDALYLTHVLARYVPQLIALSASSPFYQGVDTGYQSARSNVFSAFPLSGVIPYLTTWHDFSVYFYKMRNLNIIKTMKDFYWDIRPKPEFGTVEIRVCDTPLTIKKAVLIAAYAQTLAHYLLTKKPIQPTQDLYFLYGYNRFQACRYGLEGVFIDPYYFHHVSILDDILKTMDILQDHALLLGNSDLLLQLLQDIKNNYNDAVLLRQIFQRIKTFPAVVREQCLMWEKRAT